MLEKPLKPACAEVLIKPPGDICCETYIFEPSVGEEEFGYFFASCETFESSGFGPALLETIITAIRNEYYREPGRLPSRSFEMALHQANLILHDMTEQGVRNWMGYLNIATGVLTDRELHISVSGEATVYLARKARLTCISEGLSHHPITNPLSTFSQVASGTVSQSDTLFFSTSAFQRALRPVDITRISLDRSANTIAARLQQQYEDQGTHAPLGVVVVVMLPEYIAHTAREESSRDDRTNVPQRTTSGVSAKSVQPFRPLNIQRNWQHAGIIAVIQVMTLFWKIVRKKLFPILAKGSLHGRTLIIQASKATGKNIYSLTTKKSQFDSVKSKGPPFFKKILIASIHWIVDIPRRIQDTFSRSPQSSRVLVVICTLLVIVLGVSIMLLQRKRATDESIQRASEMLHEARTKKDAAATALIYNNRDQALVFLEEARDLTRQLSSTDLYVQEIQQLNDEIVTQSDHVQRISRVKQSEAPIVGDVSQLIKEAKPSHIFIVEHTLYTFHPLTNEIIMITPREQAKVVHETTQGIGFFSGGVPHDSDKTIVLWTDSDGIAIFDSRDNTINAQEIDSPSAQPDIRAIGVYGNRLYLYDSAARNIFSYNKTLRGFSDRQTWIRDTDAPRDGITSLAIDGSIFALYKDGMIRQFYKGNESEFSLEAIKPSLEGSRKLMTTDKLEHLYVADTSNKRIVIIAKDGSLIKQLYLEKDVDFIDAVISPDERYIYLLDGHLIREVMLAQENNTP